MPRYGRKKWAPDILLSWTICATKCIPLHHHLCILFYFLWQKIMHICMEMCVLLSFHSQSSAYSLIRLPRLLVVARSRVRDEHVAQWNINGGNQNMWWYVNIRSDRFFYSSFRINVTVVAITTDFSIRLTSSAWVEVFVSNFGCHTIRNPNQPHRIMHTNVPSSFYSCCTDVETGTRHTFSLFFCCFHWL